MDLREIGWGVEWMQLAQGRARGGLLKIRWWTCGFWSHGFIWLFSYTWHEARQCEPSVRGWRLSLNMIGSCEWPYSLRTVRRAKRPQTVRSRMVRNLSQASLNVAGQWLALLLSIQEIRVQFSTQRPAILAEGFLSFSQSF
jgi:hypothetical protein